MAAYLHPLSSAPVRGSVILKSWEGVPVRRVVPFASDKGCMLLLFDPNRAHSTIAHLRVILPLILRWLLTFFSVMHELRWQECRPKGTLFLLREMRGRDLRPVQ
jgi:hypothetical protein